MSSFTRLLKAVLVTYNLINEEAVEQMKISIHWGHVRNYDASVNRFKTMHCCIHGKVDSNCARWTQLVYNGVRLGSVILMAKIAHHAALLLSGALKRNPRQHSLSARHWPKQILHLDIFHHLQNCNTTSATAAPKLAFTGKRCSGNTWSRAPSYIEVLCCYRG